MISFWGSLTYFHPPQVSKSYMMMMMMMMMPWMNILSLCVCVCVLHKANPYMTHIHTKPPAKCILRMYVCSVVGVQAHSGAPCNRVSAASPITKWRTGCLLSWLVEATTTSEGFARTTQRNKKAQMLNLESEEKKVHEATWMGGGKKVPDAV